MLHFPVCFSSFRFYDQVPYRKLMLEQVYGHIFNKYNEVF